MKSDMLLAVMQLSAERSLPQDSVIAAFEDAIAAAYRRDPAAEEQDVKVQLDPESGEVTINTVLHVVDEVDELELSGQVSVEQARAIDYDAEVGDEIITGVLEFTPQRIAARTVTQVLMQRLRTAERQLVYEQYADKEGEIISAPIRRIVSQRNSDDAPGSRPTVLVDLGKADATMPSDEQSPNERYRTGMELKFFVTRVSDYTSNVDGVPEIVVSRRHPMLLRRLMELEVPEVKSGLVEIKSIARHAGARSKVAVYSNKHDVDPIGACVGLRGIRIQNIVTELMGEKIDILEWSEDPAVFIANSLGPAQVEQVIVDDEATAEVIVPENQLSLAIGKEGQNVSLATRLTDFRIDIKGSAAYAEELIDRQRALEADAVRKAEEEAEAARLAAEAAIAERIAAEQAAAEKMAAEQAALAKAAAEEAERQLQEEQAAVKTETDTSEIEPVPTLFVPVGDLDPISEDEDELVANLEEDLVAIDGDASQLEHIEAVTEPVEVAEETEPAEVSIAAELEQEVIQAVDEGVGLAEDDEQSTAPTPTTPRPVPSLFVPNVQRPERAPIAAEETVEPEEDLDLELLELEEKLKELEIEEQQRLETERQAAEFEALEQDIDSDDLWVLPNDLNVAAETTDSGLRFAEDISGYRDDDGSRGSRRGGRRGGGASRTRR